MENMNQKGARRDAVASRRIVAAALALGGVVSGSLVDVGSAGAAAKTFVVSTSKNAKLGTILVAKGETVYVLKSSKTGCTASSCLKFWPEVVLPKGVSKATAGAGVTASKLGTMARAGGIRQVTYGGRPLYWFAADKAGKANGNGVKDLGGTWSVVVTTKPATSPGATTTTGGGTTTTGTSGGYGY